MTRNLKALGLTILATFAIDAGAASIASAAQFHSEGNETELSGKLGKPFSFSMSTGTVKCSTGSFTGKMSATTTTTIAVIPTYSGCTGAVGTIAKVSTNGCEYVFHTEGEGTGSISVVCPKEKELTITEENWLGEDICTIHIHANSGLGTGTFTNVGTGTTKEITIDVEIHGVTYTETKGTSKESCTTSKTTHNGIVDEDWEVTGGHVVGGKTTHTALEVK